MQTRVGHPYSHRGGPLPEGAYYAWCGDRHELAVVQRAPAAPARLAVTKGEVELAFVHHSPVLVVLSRFGGMGDPWREAPFCWHLLPRSERHQPRPLREGESSVLDLVLVRAEDGIVDALGWMTLDPAFSWVLHRAICEEAGRAWDPIGFHRAFEALRARYPSTDSLLELAVPCRRARIEGRAAPSRDQILAAEPASDSQGRGTQRPPERPQASDADDTAVTRLPDPGDGC